MYFLDEIRQTIPAFDLLRCTCFTDIHLTQSKDGVNIRATMIYQNDLKITCLFESVWNVCLRLDGALDICEMFIDHLDDSDCYLIRDELTMTHWYCRNLSVLEIVACTSSDLENLPDYMVFKNQS